MHRARADFRKEYRTLTAEVRDRADKQLALLKAIPRHPSLQFNKITERAGQELGVRATIGMKPYGVP